MKRMIAAVVLVGVVVAAGGAIVWGALLDEREAKGNVVMGVPPFHLYICEPGESVIAGPSCGADDDGTSGGPPGPAELIFETTENLLPGIPAQWDVRIQNVGPVAWDTAVFGGSFAGTIRSRTTETNDPGDDCNVTPQVTITILGKVATVAPLSYDEVNDNHLDPSRGNVQLESNPSDFYRVHVGPGDYEDMRIRFNVLAPVPDECSENAWEIEITLRVEDHVD